MREIIPRLPLLLPLIRLLLNPHFYQHPIPVKQLTAPRCSSRTSTPAGTSCCGCRQGWPATSVLARRGMGTVARRDMGGVLGGSGGWARVKSGFVFPTKTPLRAVFMRRGATNSCMDVSYTRSRLLADTPPKLKVNK